MDLEDVADAESDAGLDARDQLIVARRVVEQRSHEDLTMTTTTHTHTHPFNGLFFRGYPGETVPER